MSELNPDRALIFRIVHVANLPWILAHGLTCRNAPRRDPHFVDIGHPDLIDRRAQLEVPLPPGGTFSDYVPFYFTPLSIMLFNIHTGRNVPRRENHELVIVVSSLRRVAELGLSFVFTNQHACSAAVRFFNSLEDLPTAVDWELLRSRNFKTDDADPGRGLRYQAEAMVHAQVPLAALLGIGCADAANAATVKSMIEERGLDIKVRVAPNMFFQ